MSATPNPDRIRQAQRLRDRAYRRLRRLQLAALLGQYDAEEYDEAMAAYRAAESDVYAALRGDLDVCSTSACDVPTSDLPRSICGDVPAAFRHAFPDAGDPLPGDTIPAHEAEASQPLVPTARMRFARWLVETGRLTDGPSRDAAATHQPPSHTLKAA